MDFPVINVRCGKCASWRISHPVFGWSYCKKHGWRCDGGQLCADFRPSADSIRIALASWKDRYGEMGSIFLSSKTGAGGDHADAR